MTMAITLKKYLDELGIHYEIVKHSPTYTSMETAAAAHVPGDKLVKTVLLKDDKKYVVAVIPSTYHVQLSELPLRFNRRLVLAQEEEISRIFTDCEAGAITPIGHAYKMDIIFDNRLLNQDDLYIEAGDHENLVHINNSDFSKLMTHAQAGDFTQHN